LSCHRVRRLTLWQDKWAHSQVVLPQNRVVGVIPVVPPATLGMLGGGQLGRYAVLAARQMGYRTIVLDPDPRAPAGALADEHLVAAFDDPTALDRLAGECAVVTTEFENPPAAGLARLAAATRVAPPPQAVAVAQDRIAEKAFLVAQGLPVGPYRVLATVADVVDAVDDSSVGYPARLKTARLGYDGKGQMVVGSAAELRGAWDALGAVPCVLERALELTTEISVVAARSATGDFVAYPVAENRHVDGILDVSVVPAAVDLESASEAVQLTRRVADALGYVGVLAVEMFVTADGLLVNEIAPRPHNSGHWTLDAARTSQFAQQVRAVCGVVLGDASLTAGGVAMVNLLGDVWAAGEPDWAAALGPNVALHLYGKAEPRPGRKMGHLTAWGDTPSDARDRALAARAALRRV
jgi:5-(carboxyamino)imidazole ribonucleotide synthase